MTPEETYRACKTMMERKKELDAKNMKSVSVRKILDSEFPELCEKKPFIYNSLISGKITMKQFKQFAESTQSIVSQMTSAANTTGKPPEPVIFD